MTVEEFLAWSEDHPGRHALVAGTVIAMAPQTVGHARTKYRVHTALARALEVAGLDCQMLPDGVTVRIDDYTAFEPDALVACGPRIADDAKEAASPLLVVEVLLPSTKHIDTGRQLEGYFRIPSLQHYLVVDPKGPLVIYHRRGADGIAARILSEGTLDLDPPGLTLPLAAFFVET